MSEPALRYVGDRLMQCKDIPDQAVLDAVADRAPGWSTQTTGRIREALERQMGPVPWNLLLAKLRRLVARGLADGCPCGCSGGFTVTSRGQAAAQAERTPMPDLHTWLTDKIAAVEQAAHACPPSPARVDIQDGDYLPGEIRDTAGQVRATGLLTTPAATLRRCAADRKLLEIHSYHGGTYDVMACTGCGYDDTGYLVDHVNDCETLQALAEGYGITADEMAYLDRPEPQRPPSSPADAGKPLGDLFREAFDRYAERLEPERAGQQYEGGLTVRQISYWIPIAKDHPAVPPALRGPNWKGDPDA